MLFTISREVALCWPLEKARWRIDSSLASHQDAKGLDMFKLLFVIGLIFTDQNSTSIFYLQPVIKLQLLSYEILLNIAADFL